jgi:hypothetical protein
VSPNLIALHADARALSSFPYLVAINSVLPALVAGNAVLLKPSPQTPLAAERLALAFKRAGLPEHVLQILHLSPQLTTYVVQHTLVSFVSFTGSVAGGREIEQAAVSAKNFKGVALEVRGQCISKLNIFDSDFKCTAWWEGSSLCPGRCRSQLHRL